MSKVWDIHGGVHPPENKHQSVSITIQQAKMPRELIFPLPQHPGSPTEAIVDVGDRVLKGQLIATSDAFLHVPTHSSTSGEVVAIEDRSIPHAANMQGPCIVIKPDQKDKWATLQPLPDYKQSDKIALINAIHDAGIGGMGGAGFPTAKKINTRSDHLIETLIINGTECEPYITADDMLMRERADAVIAGVAIMQYIIDPSKEVLIGIEDNKPEAIAAMREALGRRNDLADTRVVSFPTKYPSGGEKQLIQILTGKEVPSKKLPADVGVVCSNIGTCAAVYRAIHFGEPLISRITTITGAALGQPCNYDVLIGTPVEQLLSLSGYDTQRASRLIMGGPMMGFAFTNVDMPIVKTTNCIIAATENELPTPPPAQACIRCGMCAEACPMTLLPQQLYWFARAQEFEHLQSHQLFDCIECGACSYVCPSNIPLVQYYRASKAQIRQQDLEHNKAEIAKSRFEYREARIEKIAQEREAKKKARKAAAQTKANDADSATDSKADIIKAAIERSNKKKAEAAAKNDGEGANDNNRA